VTRMSSRNPESVAENVKELLKAANLRHNLNQLLTKMMIIVLPNHQRKKRMNTLGMIWREKTLKRHIVRREVELARKLKRLAMIRKVIKKTGRLVGNQA
jgi:hypothetical protein